MLLVYESTFYFSLPADLTSVLDEFQITDTKQQNKLVKVKLSFKWEGIWTFLVSFKQKNVQEEVR